jgi:methionyl-tRNA synthetase
METLNTLRNRVISSKHGGVCRANQLLEETAPWTALKKGSEADKAAAHVTLVAALEGTRVAAVLLSPVVPELSQRIHDQLGLDVNVQVRSRLFANFQSHA